MKPMNIVDKELSLAGTDNPITPELLELDRFRIMSDTPVPAEEYLLRMFGKPCFPRRDLSTVTGLEKCGKTFFTSMLMACCAEKQVLELERIREQPLKVMWYDTEQSRQSTKTILTDRVFIINQLMQLSTENDCNITVVIHLNRSGEKRSLRGWLGTEILHKAFEVYYCEQIEQTDVFSVEQIFTRKYRIGETLYYKISDEGLPEVTVKPDYQPRDSGGRFMSNKPEAYQIKSDKADSFNQKYIIRNDGSARLSWEWDLRLLFGDAMSSAAEVSVEMLKGRVMQLGGIKQPKYYDKVFKLAIDQRIVQTTMDRNGRIVVIPVSS